MHFVGSIRKVRIDFVEMQVLEQVETGRTKNVCILQNLHSIPIAVPDQQGQWSPRNRNEFIDVLVELIVIWRSACSHPRSKGQMWT